MPYAAAGDDAEFLVVPLSVGVLVFLTLLAGAWLVDLHGYGVLLAVMAPVLVTRGAAELSLARGTARVGTPTWTSMCRVPPPPASAADATPRSTGN